MRNGSVCQLREMSRWHVVAMLPHLVPSLGTGCCCCCKCSLWGLEPWSLPQHEHAKGGPHAFSEDCCSQTGSSHLLLEAEGSHGLEQQF